MAPLSRVAWCYICENSLRREVHTLSGSMPSVERIEQSLLEIAQSLSRIGHEWCHGVEGNRRVCLMHVGVNSAKVAAVSLFTCDHPRSQLRLQIMCRRTHAVCERF